MKFTIRDVLWLTVVVALAVCWALDRASLHRAEMRAREEAVCAIHMAEVARAAEALARAQAEMTRAAEQLSAAP